MRLSFTTLETYRHCPLKFKFKEIDKIKTPQTKEAFFGSLIHDTLKMFHDPNRLTPPTEEETLEYFAQNWNPAIFADKREEPIAFSTGVKLLKNYYGRNYPTQFNIVDLETRFEAPISDAQNTHIISGIIDRIDRLENGVFEIIDYKTGKRMPGQKIVDDNLQLAIYHLGVANRWPSIIKENRPVKLSLYFLQHEEKLSTTRLPAQLEETKQKILFVIDKIKADLSRGKFEAMPGPLCSWCAYQPQCPFFKHKFKEKIPGDDDIKKLTEEYFILKGQSDANSKRLNEIKHLINLYFDDQKVERVFSDSGYLTRTAKKTFIYDGNALKNILEPIGKWKEVLAVDAAKLKGIIAGLPLEIKRKIEEVKKINKEIRVITVTRNKSKSQTKSD